MAKKNPAAVALGRLGGKARSDSKTAAARQNAKKGGWPKGRPRKVVSWWEYSCPECDATNVLPNPPFPTVHTCECGKSWDVQKLNAGGYIYSAKETIP
jgi:hypothetical protein